MQPNTDPTPSTPPSDASKQAPHHTRQEDAEYIGAEILKDTIGPPPVMTPPLQRMDNEWPTPLAMRTKKPVEPQPARRSFLETLKGLFRRKS